MEPQKSELMETGSQGVKRCERPPVGRPDERPVTQTSVRPSCSLYLCEC